MADRDGAPQARCVARAGGSGDERGLSADQRAGAEGDQDLVADISGTVPQQTSVPASRTERALGSAQSILDADSGADGNGRPRAADRVCECGEPAGRARRRPAERSGDSPGARRRTCGNRSPAADRKLSPRGRRRGGGPGGRVVDRGAALEDAAVRSGGANALGRARRAGHRVRFRGCGADGDSLRPRPGAAIHAPRPHHHAQGRIGQRGRRHRARALQERPRRRAGRSFGAAPRRRRAVCAQPVQPQIDRSRLRRRPTPEFLDRSIAQRLSAPARRVAVRADANRAVDAAAGARRGAVGDFVAHRQQLEQHGQSGGLQGEGGRGHEPEHRRGRSRLLRHHGTGAGCRARVHAARHDGRAEGRGHQRDDGQVLLRRTTVRSAATSAGAAATRPTSRLSGS